MDAAAAMELDAEGESLGGSSQSVKKNIPLKLKPSPVKKGKAKKGAKSTRGRKRKVEETEHDAASEEEEEETVAPFMPAGHREPLHQGKRLKWDHKVNLIGEKITDPVLHCCDNCNLPILMYGRMIPCKHVFCLSCAHARSKAENNTCPRCSDPVQRIESAPLGKVFVCTQGGSKHGTAGCRRTYLSRRDLASHVKYRHQNDSKLPPSSQESLSIRVPAGASGHMDRPHLTQPPPADPAMYPPRPPEGINLSVPPPTLGLSISAASSAAPESYRTIPVMSSGSSRNLITVPIQDEQESRGVGYSSPQYSGPPPHTGPGPMPGGPQGPYPQGPPPHFPPGGPPTRPPPGQPPFSASGPPPIMNPPAGITSTPNMSLPPPRNVGPPPPHYSGGNRQPWPGPGQAPPQHRGQPSQHPQYY